MTSDFGVVRLRRANPFPRVPELDRQELFVRITALPADSRLARRASSRRRRLIIAAASLALMAVLASAAFAISNWVFAGPVQPKVTKFEYRQAQSQLTLPPGYSWPSLHIAPNSLTSPGAGGGHAVLAAQNAWECYWVKAIAAGDIAAQQRAHEKLNQLLDNNIIVAPPGAPENWTPPRPPARAFAVFADDGGLEWVRQTYALAAAGEPQRLISSCKANGAG
jgi:hypothetical protein